MALESLCEEEVEVGWEELGGLRVVLLLDLEGAGLVGVLLSSAV
jgi:hypothetical protein